MRPDIMAWTSGTYLYSEAIAISTLVGILRHFGTALILFRQPIALGLLGLQVPIFLSAMSAVNPALSYDPYLLFVRMTLMVLLTPILIQTVQHLRQLLIVMAVSLGFLGGKFGLWGLIHGGVRYDSGYGGMLSDNNCLALGLAMAVPLCWYCRQMVQTSWVRLCYLLMVFFTTAAVVMTHSRGGALSLAVVFLCILFHSKRKVGLILLIAILIVPSIYLVRETYIARLKTLEDVDSDSSARSRMNHQLAAFKMWKDYPLLGVGFGSTNYVSLVEPYLGYPDIHVVHNNYLQMLVDSGIFSFVIYVGLLFGTIAWLESSARKTRRQTPGAEVYPYAIQAPLIAFAVGSLFLSRVSFDLVYMFLMCAASWWVVCSRRAAAEQDQQTQRAQDSVILLQDGLTINSGQLS